RLLGATITLSNKVEDPILKEHQVVSEPEFGDSYKAHDDVVATGSTTKGTSKKKGRTIALTIEDMQKRKNDVKARTTLLLALHDEHQLQFSNYKTAQQLWAAILKTFRGNKATKKTKKNLLKQQYGNFKAKGSETLEQTFNRLQTIVSHLEFMDIEIEQDDLNQKFLTSLAPEWLMHTIRTFNRLQAIVSHLQFMDIEIEQDDLNQKFLTSLAPEWLMHIIIWRNRSDLDTMSLDDLYNHLKVYESEVQKKSDSNSQNMAFISSAKNSSGKEDVNTASISTASTNVSPASVNIGAVSISQDTACAYIASQSSGSQIKFKDITQIDEDDIEEIDIKWNMVLLSMRADRFWKKTGKKISIQGTDVARFDKSKVKCFNCHKMGHFTRECRAPRSQDRGRKDNYRQRSMVEEQAPKALMAIDGVGWHWSFMANEEEDHALAADRPTEDTTDKVETAKKPTVKYAELYRKTTKRSNGNSQNHINDKGYWDSSCSWHMTGNISYLSEYEPCDGGYVSFGQGGCKITGKGTIKTEIENLKELRVKIIKCDNRGEFRNKEMNDFCLRKGIKREFSNARTPQQNGVAEKINRTLIEAARTMVLVNKPQNKTPYELFNGRSPSIGFLKPFGCHVMILNTLDNLGKFEAKGDEGYFLGYSMSSKAFRVFNNRTKRVEENLHVDFLENKPIEKGAGLNWLFDIDSLTNSMNYVPVVVADTNSTNFSGTKEAAVETPIPTISSPVPTACLNDFLEPSSDTRLISKKVTSQDDTPSLDNILALTNMFKDILGVTTNTDDTNEVEADLGNMETTIIASHTPTFKNHKDHPKSQIISPVDTPIQTRNKSKEMEEQSFIATIHQKTNPALLQFYIFSCFLSQVEPKKISDALQDPSWVEAMQEEFLQFKIQNVWNLVDCPKGVRPTGIKWVLKNKKEIQAFMHEKFQMSAMGELNFFLGLQVLQKEDGIFLSQDKYGKDGTGKDVDLHLYRSMIGSLMYLTASRPDIMFPICACTRHQVTPKECQLHTVKRIFRYLKGHPKLGLWYPKESPFDLVAYSDSDYGGASQDRK
nr:hypothetical protein [Tanacetum cinerariifolium]